MVHLRFCFQFGEMPCYRQVPRNGAPQILFAIWWNDAVSGVKRASVAEVGVRKYVVWNDEVIEAMVGSWI